VGIFGAIDTSASGLTAQRLRLDLIANNIANINTTRTGQTTAAGNPIPYRRQMAVFVPRPATPGFARILNDNLQRLNQGKLLDGAEAQGVGQGVQVAAIVADQSPFRLEYDPESPDAAKPGDPEVPAGYVRLPNVNIVTEMVDMVSASRAYEANVTVLNASKSMLTKAMEIGRG